jgi:ABC-type branched-subunit amino acid transport system substrate-binding protein
MRVSKVLGCDTGERQEAEPWRRLVGASRRVGRLGFLALWPLLGTACLSTDQTSPPPEAIHIGTVLPFTGSRAASGVALESALQEAIVEVNAAGGLDGRPLWLDVRDSHSDDERGIENALRLLDDNPIPYFIGTEEPTIAYRLANTIKTHQMVHLMPGLTSPQFHDSSGQAAWFRLAPSTKYLACSLAKRMRSDGIATANVVVDPDDYSGTFATQFGRVFSTKGGVTLPSLQMQPDPAAFGNIFDANSRYQPDATVLLTSPSVAAAFLQEWAVRGKHGKWYLGPTLNNPELLRNVPAGILEGMTGISADLGPEAGTFRDFIEARTGVPAVAGSSNYYFDAVALLALAVNRGIGATGTMPPPAAMNAYMTAVTAAGATPVSFAQLADGLALVRAGQDIWYQGAAGNYVLDVLGDSTLNRGTIWQIHGQGFVDVDYIQCDTVEVEAGR